MCHTVSPTTIIVISVKIFLTAVTGALLYEGENSSGDFFLSKVGDIAKLTSDSEVLHIMQYYDC